MAQPTTFMLQHNNISQVNDLYYTNNITKKYLGYKYKFVFFLKKILKFSFIRKYKIKLKILMLKSTQKKTFKYLKTKLKPKVAKLRYINYFDRILTRINKNYIYMTRYKIKEIPLLHNIKLYHLTIINKNYIFNKFFFFKKLKAPQKKKRKFFKIKWTLKKKTLKRLFRRKRKPFSIGLIRLIRIKDITFLSYILKKIKYKKYNRFNRFKLKKQKKYVFLNKKQSINTKKKRIRLLTLNSSL